MFYLLTYFCLSVNCSLPSASTVFLDQKKCEIAADKAKTTTVGAKCLETPSITIGSTNYYTGSAIGTGGSIIRVQ